MKIISLLSLAVISLYVTGTCYALTPQTRSAKPVMIKTALFAAPALTPKLKLNPRTTLTPPQLGPVTTSTVMVESRGSGGAARFAANSFRNAAYAGAAGDGIGFGVYIILGVIGLALVVAFLLVEEDDDGSGYKSSRFSPTPFSFSF